MLRLENKQNATQPALAADGQGVECESRNAVLLFRIELELDAGGPQLSRNRWAVNTQEWNMKYSFIILFPMICILTSCSKQVLTPEIREVTREIEVTRIITEEKPGRQTCYFLMNVFIANLL